MSAGKLQQLKKEISNILHWSGTKSAKDKTIIKVENLYHQLGDDSLSDEYRDVYDLFNMSNHIFLLATQEVSEINDRWCQLQGKVDEKQAKLFKTRLFELSIYHLRKCSHQKIENSVVKWITYCLNILSFPWVKAEIGMEAELSKIMLLCSDNSNLPRADFSHLKKLWECLWSRIEDPNLPTVVLKDYVAIAVNLMKNVETIVFEESPFHLVQRVIRSLKKAVFESDFNFWAHSRKYSFVYVLSHVVQEFGLEARDLTLTHIFEIVKNLTSLISVDLSNGEESKRGMMCLVNDLVKLATIDAIRDHQTMSKIQQENIKELVSTAVFESLQSAHRCFTNSQRFSLSEEQIKYLAQLLLAGRRFNPPSHDESFDSTGSKSKNESQTFCFEGLARLSFGASIALPSHRENAWNGVILILREMIQSQKLEKRTTANIISTLWDKRKAFTTEKVRVSFCTIISAAVPQNIWLGKKVPSVDSLIKYAISMMNNSNMLPSATNLIEQVILYRSTEVSKEMIRMICDSVSRSSPSSTEVLHLLSALISNTEFGEESRFSSINNDSVGNWSFRKDIIEWLLSAPSPESHPLLFELCRFHPRICYEPEPIENEDNLSSRMKQCKLINTTKVVPEKKVIPLDDSITDVVNYTQGKLKSLLVYEVTLPIFVLCYEFSLKFSNSFFDLKKIASKIQHITEDLDESEFVKSVKYFTSWPENLVLPATKQSFECRMIYTLLNLDNETIDLRKLWMRQRQEFVDYLADKVNSNPSLCLRIRNSKKFNEFVKDYILQDIGDFHENSKRMEKFSVLLSPDSFLQAKKEVCEIGGKLLNDESLSEVELPVFERILGSACIRNVMDGERYISYKLDPSVLAVNADRFSFSKASVIFYLSSLENSPYLARNIVRSILENKKMWHLYGTVLKFVVRKKALLTVCIATIPDMVSYLKVYQVHFNFKSKLVQFLPLSPDLIKKCRKYLWKPKKNSLSVTPEMLLILFGCERSRWKRVLYQFWRLFEEEPAVVCETLLKFATRCVRLNLVERLICLLRELSSSEFSRTRLENNSLKLAFDITYRSVFSLIFSKECSSEIVEMCCDDNLRFDLFQHRIRTVPADFAEDFIKFETSVAFSVESFLTNGIESEFVNFSDFGLVEFYRQLNENLTEESIRHNDSRKIYLVDFLASVWQFLPAMRPHILPIVARFKNISTAWSQFPQPPHTVANERNFHWKLRFLLSLKLMNISKWREGEYSTHVMIFLTSYHPSHYRTNLISEARLEVLKNETKMNVPCILAKILRREVNLPDNNDIFEKTLFEAVARSSYFFPCIASIAVPFLFKLCIDFCAKYELAMGKLLACLKGVKQDDQGVVLCLAECVDAIGLDVIARYERLDSKSHPEFGPRWYFVLARFFLSHGYFNHAFAIANILFDRLSSKIRNTMMIERVGLEGIEMSENMVDLLAEIYVAENNSVALGSLPPSVQSREDVRKVMQTNSKEWLRLISSNKLNSRESTILHWMCNLPLHNGDEFLDSILHHSFKEYPKVFDNSYKSVHLFLYHAALGTEINLDFSQVLSMLEKMPTIDETRLLMLAYGDTNVEPTSVEERVVKSVRDLREIVNWREHHQFQHARDVDAKLERVVKLAEALVENNAYEAAILLLDTWMEECRLWETSSVDFSLLKIFKEYVRCRSGDIRMAEINLREMEPHVKSLSDAAIAEWALVLSNITMEYRNDMDEGVRLLKLGEKNLRNKESTETKLKLLLKLHSVCLDQLSKLEEYRETRSFRMKEEAITVYQKQLNNSSRMVRGNSGDDGSRKTTQRLKREQQCERDDVERVNKSVLTAAREAISSAFNALNCISRMDDDEEAIRTASLVVFPLIDVIYKYEEDQEVIELVNQHSKSSLCPKLWLCAVTHIASKCFALKKPAITPHLNQILCRMIYDYPYHVLHTVLMYEFKPNGSEVKTFLRAVFNARTDRNIQQLREIVISMREAHAAYQEVAKLNVKENSEIKRRQVNGKTMFVWPSNLKIFKCRLQQLPIPTISQKIGRPGDYSTDGLVTWGSWKDVFSIADGLSAPKIWEIRGSDGKWYKTVWKEDDVRQDVLVEQMFDVANNMLERRILRTYNVVPLDTQRGVIEFCGGTVSIKELLCGMSRDEGLHSEFNSDEPSASKVSLMMRQVQADSTETRRKTFIDICKNYSPVFRHFFYTNFSTAHIWRDKIADYRQSLATWSIVCYIVGLGDRHASNILFDQNLCTFVHIDLGMILEYSKRTLPVPERVPFRLSRDLLDPILIEGIENGHLAEECTATIEKLKHHRKVILGVASALLRETMTNFKEAEQDHERPSYISQMAIGRLRDKLEGTDDGVTAQSSILQIRRLLREATNVDNLSRMFCGWMPFL